MDKLEAAMLLGLMRKQFKELHEDDSLECDPDIDMALKMAIECLLESQLASMSTEEGDQNDTIN